MVIKIFQENYAETVKFYHRSDAEAVKFYHRGDAVVVKLTPRRRSGGEINAKVVQNLGKFTNSPCLSAFLTPFFCEISEENSKGPLFVVLRPLSVSC